MSCPGPRWCRAGCVVAALVVLATIAPLADGRRPAVRVTSGCPETSPSYDGPCGPLFTTPQWSDQTDWSSPSAYETIALARLGGGSQEDLIGRDSIGLWVERFDAAEGQWQLLGSAEGGVALSLPNKDGWNRPSQYSTIQTANLTGHGKPELLARAADGLHVYRWNPGTATFTDVSKPPRLLSDAAGGAEASVYETIQTADLFGDGHAELLYRTPKGIDYARWNEETGQFEDVTRTGIAPDAHGGNQPYLYRTIQTGNVSGDGRADLLLLANGLRRYVREPGGSFKEQSVEKRLDNDHGYRRPSQYETVRVVRVPGEKREVLLARAADGLHVYRFDGEKWSQAAPVLTDLSDAHGFDRADEYRTIRVGEVTGDGALDVVARTAAGITVWELRAGSWVRLSTGPALTGPVWENRSHYDTIGLGDITGNGRAALVARGVFGIRTFTWHNGSFRRPLLYGDFPPFAGDEATAYEEVSRLLLGRDGDFRKLTYASPHEAITEATLNDYRARLAERCTPLIARRAAPAPPQYGNCTPPRGSGVESMAWTAVSNQIIAELWAASGVVAHFSILDGIETKLFQDQQGSLPALDRDLTLPPDPPDRTPTYLKLVRGGLDILTHLVNFFPAAAQIPRILRAISLTGTSLGAVADGLGLSDAPGPPSRYGQIAAEVAKLQQKQRDITQAQRRYVLSDYGLLSTIGAEVKGRLLTLDETAALSAGREAFALWVNKLYLPLHWARYEVSGCMQKYDTRRRPYLSFICPAPRGSYVRNRPRHLPHDSFSAVLGGGSTCRKEVKPGVTIFQCFWHGLDGATYSRLSTPVPADCRYDPTPGSTAAWRYGCAYGVPPGELIDGTNGWRFPVVHCAADRGTCNRVGPASRTRSPQSATLG